MRCAMIRSGINRVVRCLTGVVVRLLNGRLVSVAQDHRGRVGRHQGHRQKKGDDLKFDQKCANPVRHS